MKNRKEESWKFSIRTDLAIEAREMVDQNADIEVSGVKVQVQKDPELDLTVTWVEIFNEEGQKTMGKPQGNYITIESPVMKENDIDAHEELIRIMAEKLIQLKDLPKEALILVVGLGNWNVTPDALGPKVISKLMVTRHLIEHVPEQIDESVRPVSAISPGVMGLTGIETGEIIQGIVNKIHPDLIIAIDALAARKTNRINATIQISDTGVNPGSGVGNKRMSLSEETLGVPVIAIGVPTVVDAATLVNDTMDRVLDSMLQQATKGTEFYSMLQNLDTNEKYQLIQEILNPYVGNMFVTPKEVDAVIDRLAYIISNALNIALHPGIDIEDINRYTH